LYYPSIPFFPGRDDFVGQVADRLFHLLQRGLGVTRDNGIYTARVVI
jgi:hypothetical protein